MPFGMVGLEARTFTCPAFTPAFTCLAFTWGDCGSHSSK
jgi:hypothetical protein